MPWTTPALRDVRTLVRDGVRGTLPGSDTSVPNSVLRVLCDAMAALAHLTLQYIDWLAKQLLPDTAETEWLDRHGRIWLRNADGSVGRKLATLAQGTVMITGQLGVGVPVGSRLAAVPQTPLSPSIEYETLNEAVIGTAGTPVQVRAIDTGAQGNQEAQAVIGFAPTIPGVDTSAEVVLISGGADDETDEELRMRVLLR